MSAVDVDVRAGLLARLPGDVVRNLTDAQLVALTDWDCAACLLVLEREAERRAQVEQARQAALSKRARARVARDRAAEEHALAVEAAYVAAEAACAGHLLRPGSWHIDPRSLFTGPLSRVRRHASEELQDWFAANGRPTVASWRADTRRSAADARETYKARRAAS